MYPYLVERPRLNIAYYMFFVLYNFVGALRLVWRKENCIPVWIALGVFNIILHLFPSCLSNYDMWYLVPNWIYFSENIYLISIYQHINFISSIVIQVLSVCLLLDTFLYLRTKNNFNRNMLERRCRSQREIPTPHTHYLPRGFQDDSKDARDEVKTTLKSNEEKKEVNILINNEKSQNIYVVDN